MRNLPQVRSIVKVLIAISAITSCEMQPKTDKPTEKVDKPIEEKTEKSGKPTGEGFTIGDIKVVASQTVFQNDAIPKDKEMMKCLKKELTSLTPFAAKGERIVSGQVTYDYQAKRDAPEEFMIALFGALSEKGDGITVDVGTRLTHSDPKAEGKTASEISTLVCKQFATQVASQWSVLSSNDEDLVAFAKDDATEAQTMLRAIQEIRERNLTDATPILVTRLEHPNTAVAVAAAAGLSRFQNKDAGSAVLKLAERLSRERDPQYVPMLHILADFGGAEIRSYLQTVSEHHSADAVRQIAAEALKNAK